MTSLAIESKQAAKTLGPFSFFATPRDTGLVLLAHEHSPPAETPLLHTQNEQPPRRLPAKKGERSKKDEDKNHREVGHASKLRRRHDKTGAHMKRG